MERLTEKHEADAQRKEYERRLANGYPRNIPEERFLRLAAYEDTGLTPEEVAVLQERTRWIPVEERLPEVEAWYLVAILDKKLKKTKVEQDLFAIGLAKRYGNDAGFCKARRWEDREKLIAWMPLPEPPEVK